MVQSCSDTQLFTGAAYALALRYYRGCTITAYHYNVVASMLLLTCATHLMSITIVRDPWKYPWLNIIRIICMTGVFIVTGLLLANQNVDQELKFPTAVPNRNLTDSPMFLQAACFQSGSSMLIGTLGASYKDKNAASDAFFRSDVSNHIEGWRFYLMILLWYGVAIIAEIVRLCLGRKGKKVRQGCFRVLRRITCRWISREAPHRVKNLVQFIHLVYITGGVGLSCATIIISGQHINNLRVWVKYSGWMKLKDQFNNPEDDATSFGQLVPIFTSALIAFTFLELISGKYSSGSSPFVIIILGSLELTALPVTSQN